MSYQLKVIKDSPIGFWPLDESSGAVAYDISGCSNNGSYVGPLTSGILPLVSGGSLGTKINDVSYLNLPINNNYYGIVGSGGFAKEKTSDNDFSLELWIYPKINTSSRTVLFGDEVNGIGLFYEKGSIVFKLQNEELYYTLNYLDKSMHIVGVYGTTSMTIYVDGIAVASKSLNDFKFTNSLFSPKIGPTTSSSDYLIVDAPAVYRYALNSIQCLDHYQSGISVINSLHVTKPDQGKLFTLNDEVMDVVFKYEYTESKFRKFITEDVYYDNDQKHIVFYRTDDLVSKDFIINDILMVPTGIEINSSKIEWRGNNGISVEVSSNGTDYIQCVNGDALPMYKKGSPITPGPLYIKITMSTSDASKYLPKLSLFRIRFYSNKKSYSDNSGFFVDSVNEYSLGSFNFPILSRHASNGLKTSTAGGFKIAIDQPIRSIEMFLTPSSIETTTLISTSINGSYPASNLSWNSSGVISKTNIDKIYINGQDKTAQTNVSGLFSANNMSHVVIVFAADVSGDIEFNLSGPSNLYNNIAIYNSVISTAKALEHYNLYIGRPASRSSDSSFQMTEQAPEIYNNDWVVFSTI